MVEGSHSRSLMYFPARYGLALMSCYGIFVAYTLRVNLSVAMVEMVDMLNSTDQANHTESVCRPSQPSFRRNHTASMHHWDSETQGWILSSFYYGYIFMQLPGAYLASRYGAKWLMGLGILSTAVFTLLTPVAANMGAGYLIAVRILEGIGSVSRELGPVPWGSIVTCRPVWAVAVAHFCSNWTFYTLLTLLPTYMNKVLGFNIQQNGLLSALPYLGSGLLTVLGGQLADYLRESCQYRTVVVRKAFTLAATFYTLFGQGTVQPWALPKPLPVLESPITDQLCVPSHCLTTSDQQVVVTAEDQPSN
ncbi:hypothetical protein CRUP_026878 [Coryphaenoides rupestris]|nr:hypothetical protein CRUP_026878 [Coryphaenoides rupestris]